MDERLEKALAFSKYRVTIENRKKALRRRFETMLVVHKNNGMFRADPETVGFIIALLNEGHEDAILIDIKQNPVEIDDLVAFKDELLNTYFTASNEYMSELKKLAKARDVKKAMDW